MRGRLTTILMTFGAVILVVSTMGDATPAYIWNASNSVPIGLYRLQPVDSRAVTELVAVRPVSFEVEHARRRQRLRIRDRVSVRIRDRYQGDETVTCVIPGHDRSGEELVADELVVEDGPLAFSYRGVCGYGTTFDYSG